MYYIPLCTATSARYVYEKKILKKKSWYWLISRDLLIFLL